MLGMGREQMEQVPSTSQFRYYKQLIVDTKDIVQTNDIVMSPQFAQDIDFFLQLGNVLWIIAQHDTLAGKLFSFSRAMGRGIGVSFWFTSRGNADLSVGALSNDQVSV